MADKLLFKKWNEARILSEEFTQYLFFGNYFGMKKI